MKLLIVEDDKQLSQSIVETIEHQYDYKQAYDGEEALYLAETGIYDLILLDIMLPEIDGFEVLKKLRKKGVYTPVCMLTALDSVDNRIKGLNCGADDYIVKPFNRDELLARIEAILRRTNAVSLNDSQHFKKLILHINNRVVTCEGHVLKIQGKYFELLSYFLSHENVILTKEQIFDRIWGFDSDTTLSVVEVYMSGLRKELKPFGYDKYFKTVRGLGYILTDGGMS